MIWKHLDAADLAHWMYGVQSDGPPYAYELMPPGHIADLGRRGAFSMIDDVARFRGMAGGLNIRLDGLDPDVDRDVVDSALLFAAYQDKREEFTLEETGDEEAGRVGPVRSAVTEEHWLRTDGVAPVGPGGRITYYRSARRLEIAFHVRRIPLQGRWRDVESVAREALDSFGGQVADGERLRAAFGYYEASGWERQDLLRPVFVVLVDRIRRDQGPRWRLASVIAATDIDDAPPTAGLESVAGCA